ncbi:MAG: hypothetical protein JKY19_14105 [Alcanivoracaceae bacterium]|nr:hypothetical protein [Alcanivoracaceae bacterium]
MLDKKIIFFYVVEFFSALAFTYFEGFSGLIWLTVAISFIGIIPKSQSLSGKISDKSKNIIAKTCLILSSALWGYIMLYSLTSAPVIYTAILVARVLATLIAFREIRDHVIVVLPLLIAFALLKPAGCIPPIAF